MEKKGFFHRYGLVALEEFSRRFLNEEKVLAETENGDTGVDLSLRYRGLTELPESLDRLSELQCLDVTGNQLTELPEWLGNLQNLK